MKKLFFLLAFAFIGTQAYSQVYMLAILDENASEQCDDQNKLTLLKVSPDGEETVSCICELSIQDYALIEQDDGNNTCLSELNIELNNIINEGYKLLKVSTPSSEGDGVFGYAFDTGVNGSQDNWHLNPGTLFLFAAP